MSKDYVFIEKWVEEQVNKIKLVRPDLDDKTIRKFVRKKAADMFKDHKCVIVNNHRNKSANTSLLNLIEYISEHKPIIAGQGVLFKSQEEMYSPLANMSYELKLNRDRIKKDRNNYDKRSYEFLVRDIEQDNAKRLGNSLYGANGASTSIFYNKYAAVSITATGQALISLTETSFEQFVENNCKFYDMDECLLFIYRVLYESDYPDMDIIPHIDDIYDKTLNHLINSFMYKKKINLSILERVLNNISEEDLYKLYFKNNIVPFMTLVPRVVKIMKKVVNETESFMNPNKVPDEIKGKLDEVWEYLLEFVCHDFPIRSRIDRNRHHKRRVTVVQDTDSTMLTLQRIVSVMRDVYVDNPVIESEENMTFLLINTMAYFLTMWSKVFLKRYCRDANIGEEYHSRVNLKNEFYYPLLITMDTKKRYITSMKLQEGKLIDPPKIDIHGLELVKAETSEFTEQFFSKIIKEDIIYAKNIDLSEILRKIRDFKETIRQSIRSGNTIYLSLKTVKPPEAYEEPLSEQGIKAVNNWNIVFKSMQIQLPDKIGLLKLKTEKKQDFDRYRHLIPEEAAEAIELHVFNSRDERIRKSGYAVIAIPQNTEKIPDWVISIADIESIVYDNVAKFNPVLVSLGNLPLTTKANKVYMSNIIDL